MEMKNSTQLGNNGGPHVYSHELDLRVLIYRIMIVSIICIVINVIVSAIILTLTFIDRIVKSNTHKIILVYVILTTEFLIIPMPIYIASAFKQYWPYSHALCQFIEFNRYFYTSFKCFLVLVISVMPFFDVKFSASPETRPLLRWLPGIVALSLNFVLSIVFASLFSSSTYIIYPLNDPVGGICIQTKMLFAITEFFFNIICIISCLVSIVLSIVRLALQRRTNYPSRNECIMIVSTFTMLWLPEFIMRLILKFQGRPRSPVAVIIFSNIATLEMVLTPVLLLALPTVYRKALIRCARRVWSARTASRSHASQELTNTSIEMKP